VVSALVVGAAALLAASSSARPLTSVASMSIYVSPSGNDANPGTKSKPMRQIQAAVDAAAAQHRRYVRAAGGTYTHVTLRSGVWIYGGYDPAGWTRRNGVVALIAGAPEGVLADGVRDVTLKLLRIHGDATAAPGSSAYGIRAVNGSRLDLRSVIVTAGDGAAGARESTEHPASPARTGHPAAPATATSASATPMGPSAGRPGGAARARRVGPAEPAAAAASPTTRASGARPA
jgi:uncharacterized protein DUF1565